MHALQHFVVCHCTDAHTFVLILGGLATQPCLSSNPYDIIWHWSSCLPSPPSLLPLPTFFPPFLCFQPRMDEGEDEECQNLLCVVALPAVSPDTSISSFSPDHSQFPFFWHNIYAFIYLLHPSEAFALHFPLIIIISLPSISLTSFFLFASRPSDILFPSHSIINFNLRVELNGTVRERSMLLI